MNPKQACSMAAGLEGVTLKDHFGADSFSANKRMFLTVWHSSHQATLRLSPEHQREFLASDADAFSEQNNAWGKQGWTNVHLKHIGQAEFGRALAAAYEYSAVKVARPKAKAKTKTKAQAKKSKSRSASPIEPGSRKTILIKTSPRGSPSKS